MTLRAALLVPLTACCLPIPETHRAAATVSVAAPADRVLACTWSSWGAFDHCDDLGVGVRAGDDWAVPGFRTSFLVLPGESPLYETAFVACDGSVVTATRWLRFTEHPASVTLTAVEPWDPALRTDAPPAGSRFLETLCAGGGDAPR